MSRTAISLNYRFLLRMAVLMGLGTAIVSYLFLRVLGHHTSTVPVWGNVSMVTDIVGFSLVTGFLLSLAATYLTRQAIQERKVLPLHWHLKSQTLIDRLPSHPVHRAFMLSLAGVVLAGIMLYMLQLKHTDGLPYTHYTVLFVLHATSLSVTVTVMAVYRALGDRVTKQALTGNY
ncbi:hypothetical protein ACXYMU_08115 [Pontibacter sp. CAU 1760]